MLIKTTEKEKAINLRKQGFSYSEILREVAVAKSTLSLWLRSVGLSKKQKQRLTEKKLAAMKRGWESCHNKRLKITQEIRKKAEEEIKYISKRDLWMMGIALYWAEGAKEKENSRWCGRVAFSNSDPYMILLFKKWLKEICLVSKKELAFDLYIHETANWKNAKKYWANILSISEESIKLYFKKHKINTKRKNIGINYYGLIRLQVKKSTNLNRKIQGWINGICKNCRVV